MSNCFDALGLSLLDCAQLKSKLSAVNFKDAKTFLSILRVYNSHTSINIILSNLFLLAIRGKIEYNPIIRLICGLVFEYNGCTLEK